jgi:hypothetical protein
MTNPAHPAHSEELADRATPLGRRGLLWTGAVLAGATGAAVLTPRAAQAADGDEIVAGQENTATTTTTLTIGDSDGSDTPALALGNAGGPSLSLEALPASWAGDLAVGDIAGSELGPLVGVETLAGPATTYLVTGVDLAGIPSPFPVTPTRLLDLRTATGRANIIRTSSPSALGTDGKLAAGQWIDIAVSPTGPDYALTAAFLNLTVVAAGGGGYAAVYPPGVRPVTSTLNYAAGQTLANGAFVATGSVLGSHAVRLYSSNRAWFLLDVTGALASGIAQPPIAQANAQRKAGGRQAVIRRVRDAVAKISR